MLSYIYKFLSTRRLKIIAAMTLLLFYHGQALDAGKTSSSSAPFDLARIHFEQNVTDGDVEVVFEVQGNDEGLIKLAVTSPDGRTVIDFASPVDATLGIRQFRFESPEPKDIKSLKSAYPEGVYTFTGVSVTGDRLQSTAALNHALPVAVSILRPLADARGVGVKDLKIAWTPLKNMAAYIIEIQQDNLRVEITAKLPGSATSFTVPNGFLVPGMEYQLGIGTVAEKGNISFVESTFTTSGKK